MEEILGMIRWFAGSWGLRGFLPCDGRLLQISQHLDLFSIIGTTYGGDGTQNFALPKLDAPAGTYLICVRGLFPDRE